MKMGMRDATHFLAKTVLSKILQTLSTHPVQLQCSTGPLRNFLAGPHIALGCINLGCIKCILEYSNIFTLSSVSKLQIIIGIPMIVLVFCLTKVMFFLEKEG